MKRKIILNILLVLIINTFIGTLKFEFLLYGSSCGLGEVIPMEYYQGAPIIIEAEFLEKTDIYGFNMYTVKKVLKGELREKKILIKMRYGDRTPDLMNPMLILPRSYIGWYDLHLLQRSKYNELLLFYNRHYPENKREVIKWLINFFNATEKEKDSMLQRALLSEDEYIRKNAADFYWKKIKKIKEVNKDSLNFSILVKIKNPTLEDSILSYFAEHPYKPAKNEFLKRYREAQSYRTKKKFHKAVIELIDTTDVPFILSLKREDPGPLTGHLFWEALPKDKRVKIFTHLLDSTLKTVGDCKDIKKLGFFDVFVSSKRTERLKKLFYGKRFEKCTASAILQMVKGGEPSSLAFVINQMGEDTSLIRDKHSIRNIFNSCSLEVLIDFARSHKPRVFSNKVLEVYLHVAITKLYKKSLSLPSELYPFIEHAIKTVVNLDYMMLYLIRGEKAKDHLVKAFEETKDWRYVWALYENGEKSVADSLKNLLGERDQTIILMRLFPGWPDSDMENYIHFLWSPGKNVIGNLKFFLEKKLVIKDELRQKIDFFLALTYDEFITFRPTRGRYSFCKEIIKYDTLALPLTGTLFLLSKDDDSIVRERARRHLKGRKPEDSFLKTLENKKKDITTLPVPESLAIKDDLLENPPTFSWKHVPRATHYQIQTDSTKSFKTARTMLVNAEKNEQAITFNKLSLFAYKTFWRVRAIGKWQLSEWSVPESLETNCPVIFPIMDYKLRKGVRIYDHIISIQKNSMLFFNVRDPVSPYLEKKITLEKPLPESILKIDIEKNLMLTYSEGWKRKGIIDFWTFNKELKFIRGSGLRGFGNIILIKNDLIFFTVPGVSENLFTERAFGGVIDAIYIYRAEDFTRPIILSQIFIGGKIISMKMRENILTVVSSPLCVSCYDVSNPEVPIKIGEETHPFSVESAFFGETGYRRHLFVLHNRIATKYTIRDYIDKPYSISKGFETKEKNGYIMVLFVYKELLFLIMDNELNIYNWANVPFSSDVKLKGKIDNIKGIKVITNDYAYLETENGGTAILPLRKLLKE
ncbi:MAG: hypothetical protein E3J87_01870 [Candidatus Cloacimonadota bacterium]|nr:MAG: hypothetical protein E3J87_01870 [Candidatus Cloacimonadota bacterium]